MLNYLSLFLYKFIWIGRAEVFGAKFLSELAPPIYVVVCLSCITAWKSTSYKLNGTSHFLFNPVWRGLSGVFYYDYCYTTYSCTGEVRIRQEKKPCLNILWKRSVYFVRAIRWEWVHSIRVSIITFNLCYSITKLNRLFQAIFMLTQINNMSGNLMAEQLKRNWLPLRRHCGWPTSTFNLWGSFRQIFYVVALSETRKSRITRGCLIHQQRLQLSAFAPCGQKGIAERYYEVCSSCFHFYMLHFIPKSLFGEMWTLKEQWRCWQRKVSPISVRRKLGEKASELLWKLG